MNAQLKTIKSDFTYKIDFTYHDRKSFEDDELKVTDVCEKRGLIYDRTKLPLLRYGPGNFTCVSTFEGSKCSMKTSIRHIQIIRSVLDHVKKA